MDVKFSEIVQKLPDKIKDILLKTPIDVQQNAREIRLRAGRKICIVYGNQTYILDKVLGIYEMQECFRALCGYSVHSHLNEIKQGFITISGGHRAGLTGTAIYDENNKLTNLREISSINLRISRQICGVAQDLIHILGGKLGKLLIVGAPASGKTTLLKDIVRQLDGKFVSVVDSRGEIASCLSGIPQHNVGNADIFDCWKKEDGIVSAIKTMSPEFIVCDEIGSEADIKAVEACVGAGVELIATAHAGNLQDIMKRNVIKKILKTGAFENIAVLKGKFDPCKVSLIVKVSDLFAGAGHNDFGDLSRDYGNITLCEFKNESKANWRINTIGKLD